MARPSPTDPGIAEAIADRLIAGESMRSICDDPAMPVSSAVYVEMHRNAEFRSIIAGAREAQQEYMADHIVDISDEASPETVQVAKLRIWARQWRAGKLAPKKYGDKPPGDDKPAPININVAMFSADERANLRALAMKQIEAGKVIEHQ